MKIATKFYYHDKGKFFSYGGILELRNRKIVKLGKIGKEAEFLSFCYDDTAFSITCEDEKNKYKVDVNRIITDASNKNFQKEYLTKLDWYQQQKLLWMFRRHWMQQHSNKKHLILLIMIVTVGYFLMNLVIHS